MKKFEEAFWKNIYRMKCSYFDQISIKHQAKNRKGFAVGAVIAAEFLVGKKGFFSMKEPALIP